jgi:hypothetical protein
MKWYAAWPVVVCVLCLGMSPTYGEGARASLTDILMTDATGAPLPVTGIAGVQAITQVAPGVTDSGVIIEQVLLGNQVEEHNIIRHTLIQDSFQDNRGIVNVNQEAGNLNNQANVRVLAVVAAEGVVQGFDLTGSVRQTNNILITSGGARENRIIHSFGGTVGIVGANQSSGNLNQQANILLLGIGQALGPEAVVLGDASLGETKTNNTVQRDLQGPRTDLLTDSFTGFRGIAQVSQSSGDLNTISNVLGLSVHVETVR